jgi:hypothetical protein
MTEQQINNITRYRLIKTAYFLIAFFSLGTITGRLCYAAAPLPFLIILASIVCIGEVNAASFFVLMFLIVTGSFIFCRKFYVEIITVLLILGALWYLVFETVEFATEWICVLPFILCNILMPLLFVFKRYLFKNKSTENFVNDS